MTDRRSRILRLLLALSLVAGCGSRGALPEPAPYWTGCGAAGCQILVPEGFREADSDGVTLIRDDARIRATVRPGVPGPAGRRAAEAQIADWRREMAPVVAWSQPPQGQPDFEVFGLSGTQREGAAVAAPVHLHRVVYRNPATGSMLLLEARAPSSAGSGLRPEILAVFAEVRLTADF